MTINSNKLKCRCCGEETTTDSSSSKWNVSKEGEPSICFECDWKIYEQENFCSSEYGPEEIVEDNERIRHNNRQREIDKQERQERNEDNYYEVETLPTLGLSLSNGGKKKILY